MARTKTKGLTIKQDKFVREYVKHGNGTQAAVKAGYSIRSAKQIASANMTKHDVAKEVRIHRQRLAERLDVSVEKLVNDAAHDAEQASIKGDYSAANANRTYIAKSMGHHIERSMHVHVDTSLAHLEALKDMMTRRDRANSSGYEKGVESGQHAPRVSTHSVTDVDADDV